ncbi:zinc protease [Dokdonia pacifica]|uniref:Zinc protease n=1 Tax=Dokdonia pacifica TaxID=1627892 RepID=A0A238W9X6_9FLAO|nr:insulinase family protein [Dokdonia pacifica]GGG13670.1 zinc protease [Dokdonia pacifica]SNR43405.1 zinc protease [Dokdonia pacifica]
MKKHITLFLSLFLIVGVALAQNKGDVQKARTIPVAEIPVDPNVKVGKLSNGLTYYIRNNGKPEDKVELRLAVNAGSIMETERQLGLAHFMEHMNFNGTKNFQKNDLVDYLQSIGVKFGADLNAYTSFDETVYILPIPSDDPEKLEKGFQIIEDWAHNTTLSEEAIDGERGVVLEELRLRLGAEERMQRETLPKIMYGSRYADRLPIGTKENLENFSYDDVRDYYKTWYRPELMAVVAVGDLDVATMEQKIKDHFGKIPATTNGKTREDYQLPNHEETFIAIASDPEAAFSRVNVMYKDRKNAQPTITVDDYREGLVRNLFSQLINNRLGELRNSANPPFVFGFSFYGGTFARTKNAYQSIAQTSAEGQLDGLKALLMENERVKRFGFQQGELDRAKKSIIARLEKAYNDRDKVESGRIVGQYVNNYLEQEPIPGIEWEYGTTKRLLDGITIKEISDLINVFIHNDNRVITLTGPEKEGLTQVTENQVLALIKEVESADIKPYEDEAVRESLIEKLPAAGTIVSTTKNDALGTTTMTLSNGATVTIKKTDFKNDEVLFQAFSHGGTSLYSDEEIKATSLANGGITQAGIGGLSLTDMSKFMSGKIANVSPFLSNAAENFRGSAAPKDLEVLFQMVHLYFTDVNKDNEAYQSFVSKQKSFLGNLMANPNFYYQDKLGAKRNEGNPRYSGFPTPEKYDAADYDLAYKKFKERFADAGDFHFYFVGNVDEAQVAAFAKAYIASLPGLNSNESYIPTKFREKDAYEKFVVNRGADPKSSVSITWREETTYDDQKELAASALGEVLTIKLVEKLREEEGGVYGVGARGSLSKITFTDFDFSISFPCGPENVDKLVAAALAEVEKIKKEGVTPEDLAKVKETYLVARKEQVKTNRFWMSNLLNLDQEDRDPSYILDYEKRVNALTAEAIQKIAQEYLDENYFLAILMPEEK